MSVPDDGAGAQPLPEQSAAGQWLPIEPPPFEETYAEMLRAWYAQKTRDLRQQLEGRPKLRVPTEETLRKYRRAKEQLAKGRKKGRVARELGYKDFRALNKMMAAVEAYLRATGRSAER